MRNLFGYDEVLVFGVGLLFFDYAISFFQLPVIGYAILVVCAVCINEYAVFKIQHVYR